MVDIKLLRSLGNIATYEKGQIVFMQGDPGDMMFFAIKGVFNVYIDSFTGFPIKVAAIEPGAAFGEMSVIDGWPRSATVIADDASMALEIKKDNFQKFLEACPDVAFGLLKTISNRAQSTGETLRQLGKVQPPLHENLRNPQDLDAKTNMDNMLKLSYYIRELNEMLGVGQKPAAIVNTANDKGTLTLLPAGHPQIECATKYDNSNLLSNKKYECPYCHFQFSGKVPIFSRIDKVKITLDQRAVYSNFNMLLYNNIVCPNCNYCDSYQDFPRGYADHYARFKGNQFVNFENFTGYKNEAAHTYHEAILSHYLQLHCLNQVPKSTLRRAKTYHRLHWLYDDSGYADLAYNAAFNARSVYKQYINENLEAIDLVDLITLNVIMAQLSIYMKDIQIAIEIYTENTKIGSTLQHHLVSTSVAMVARLKDMLQQTEERR